MTSIFEFAKRQMESERLPIQQQPESVPETPVTDNQNKPSIFQYAKQEMQKERAPLDEILQASDTNYATKPGSIPGFGQGARHAARLASRAGEVVGGAPASFIQSAQQLGILGAESVAQRDFPVLRQKAQQVIEETGIPTQESFRKKSIELTKGYTAPETEGEERFDEFFQNTVGLSLPGIGTKAKAGGKLVEFLGPKGAKYLKAIGIATVGEGAQEAAGMMGAGEKGQRLAKMGAMTVASMVNRKGADKYKDSFYEKSNALLPDGATTDTKTLQTGLNILKRKLSRGEVTPSKKPALESIEAIEKKIANGKIDVRELQQFKKDLYEKIGNWEIDKKSHPYLKKLAFYADTQLRRYGKSENPKWLSAWAPANEMHGALAESAKITNQFKNWVKRSGGKHPLLIAPLFGVEKAGRFVLKPYEIANRIGRSPKLAQLYTKTLMDGAKENVTSFSRNLQKLNDEFAKEYAKEDELDLSKIK